MTGKVYNGALLSLLDRTTQKETATLAYPITRIDLYEFEGAAIKIVRSFIVDDDGHWVEKH